ncbi:hypothetical protein Hanom_Chr01g00019681 [Helianthus anomalus]
MGGRATVVAWRGVDGNHSKSGRHKRTRERRRGGGGGVTRDDGGAPPLMLMTEMVVQVTNGGGSHRIFWGVFRVVTRMMMPVIF